MFNKKYAKVMVKEIKKVEKTCKPFVEKKGSITIYELGSDNLLTWIVELCDNQGNLTEICHTDNYAFALYEFYFELCWLLNYDVMNKTFYQCVCDN